MTAPRSTGRRCSPRVYRRRRVAVSAVAMAVASFGAFGADAAAGWLGGGPLTTSEPGISVAAARLAATTTYVVQPGDTLWSIARRAQPSGDVRPLVQAIERARRGAPLQVGERVTLR